MSANSSTPPGTKARLAKLEWQAEDRAQDAIAGAGADAVLHVRILESEERLAARIDAVARSVSDARFTLACVLAVQGTQLIALGVVLWRSFHP